MRLLSYDNRERLSKFVRESAFGYRRHLTRFPADGSPTMKGSTPGRTGARNSTRSTRSGTFLLDDVSFWFDVNIIKPIDHAYYWLRTHTVNKYHLVDMRNPKNGYNWGWVDCPQALLYASFALLVRFVEKERPFEYIDWEATEDHLKASKEFMELYNWWTTGRAEEHAKFDKFAEELPRTEYAKITDEENRLRERDAAMLHRLIEIRDYLWT